MLVVSLRDCTRDSLALAGGKGANLGELIGMGAPVPDGFVVTTSAYAQAVAGRSADSVKAAQVAIPQDVEAAIRQAYAELGAGTVAVRSSATAEDLPGATFAGQQDTFLGIAGADQVLDAVQRCWASLWTDRAIAYRSNRGIPDEQVQIAVVVQRLTPSEVAGVMFTANPVTGSRDEVVIDASPGLGEAVVSGQVTPDHYVTTPDGRIAEWTPGRREVVISSTGDGSGITHTSGTASEQPVLPDSVVAELATLAGRIADHFGRPQDIEWAWAAGAVWIVQARPMTALPPPPQRLNAMQRQMETMLSDYLTARPYPIDVSTWLPHGPIGMMASLFADIGIDGAYTGMFHETDGVVDRVVLSKPKPTARLLTAPIRLAIRARRYQPATWTSDPRFGELIERVGDLNALDLAAMPWPMLVRVPRQALSAGGLVTQLRRDYLPAAGLAVGRLAVVLRLLGRSDLLGDLLHGAPTRTSAGNHALADLADIARGNPELTDAVTAGRLDQIEQHHDFFAAFQDWIADYGYRETDSPVLITLPTLGEDPAAVLSLVRVLLDSPPDHSPQRDALAELLGHRMLRGPRRQRRIRAMVEAAQLATAFREDSHAAFTLLMPAMRRALLDLGRRLTAAGVADEPTEVYHCRLEELERITDEPALRGAAGEAVRHAIVTRRAHRAELNGVPLINVERPPAKTGDGVLIAGAPASNGVATGAVRVIRGVADFGTLRSGEVLVCPHTNPAWTPLFQRAAAVVVDSGGPASHAAIVAREYGIPAVMGTREGTALLADGQRVTVDGSAGQVRRAD